MSRIIGTDKSGYATERNLSQLPFKGYRVSRASNWFRGPNYLYFKLTGRSHSYWSNLHFGFKNTDLLHFFNGISLGRQNWLSTYETFLPRWGAYGGRHLSFGLRAMARPNCKKLIALSSCAVRIQEQFLADFPAYQEEIMDKVMVLHPPQQMAVQSYEEKKINSDYIDMCLVGSAFFRKGGLELLRVVDHLIEKGAPLRLHIVSKMETGDYATLSGSQELAKAQKLIAKHPERIMHHRHLPNAEVLDLLSSCHLGLLPTWADTYGYSVLEAQAAGCPVITTNVRALPEINPPEAGWQLEMPLDESGNGRIGTEKERKHFSQVLEMQLEACLQGLWDDPTALAVKGKAAMGRIREEHSPWQNAQILENLYHKILKL